MNKTLVAAALLSVLASASFAQSAASSPDTTFQKNHPRREEVNARLANQNSRIKTEVGEGDMSKAKAARLHKDDRQIRQEERDMASKMAGTDQAGAKDAQPSGKQGQQEDRWLTAGVAR